MESQRPLRSKKVDEIRQAALEDAKKLAQQKDDEIKILQEKIAAQQRHFETMSSRQSKVNYGTVMRQLSWRQDQNYGTAVLK